QRARTAPFEERGSRSIPFNGKQVVSLIAVPESRQQQGEVHIWQFGADSVAVDGARVTAMYPDPVSPGDASLQRAAYVHGPQQNVSLAQALTLTQSSGESGTAKGLVWKSQLNSLCEPSGRAFHQANYWIENIASDHFRLAGL